MPLFITSQKRAVFPSSCDPHNFCHRRKKHSQMTNGLSCNTYQQTPEEERFMATPSRTATIVPNSETSKEYRSSIWSKKNTNSTFTDRGGMPAKSSQKEKISGRNTIKPTRWTWVRAGPDRGEQTLWHQEAKSQRTRQPRLQINQQQEKKQQPLFSLQKRANGTGLQMYICP